MMLAVRGRHTMHEAQAERLEDLLEGAWAEAPGPVAAAAKDGPEGLARLQGMCARGQAGVSSLGLADGNLDGQWGSQEVAVGLPHLQDTKRPWNLSVLAAG